MTHTACDVLVAGGGVAGAAAAIAAARAGADTVLIEREAVLVVVDGKADEIHAASRTRLTGLILDVMLVESLGQAPVEQPAATVRQ